MTDCGHSDTASEQLLLLMPLGQLHHNGVWLGRFRHVDTSELHKVCALKHSKAGPRLLCNPALLVTAIASAASGASKLLAILIAIAVKNPVYSTYQTESFGQHWSTRSQLLPALRSAAVKFTGSVSLLASTSVNAVVISTAVSIVNIEFPTRALFFAAFDFSRNHLSRLRQQLQGTRKFFDSFQRAISSEENACQPIPLSEIKTAVVSAYDLHHCLYDAIELLLNDLPKDLKKLPALASGCSAAGSFYLTYQTYLKFANILPIIEAKAQHYNLNGCNLLLCLNRLAMRAHGMAAIALAECMSVFDGDGSEDHHNPGLRRLPDLIATIKQHLNESDKNCLESFHANKGELKQILRFTFRIYRASKRCKSHVAAVIFSKSAADIRDRLRISSGSAAAIEDAASIIEEEYSIKSVLHLLECLVHAIQCARSFSSPRCLIPVVVASDFISLINSCDVHVRPAPQLQQCYKQLLSSPWLRDDSNIALFSHQILTWLNTNASFGSSIFSILQEIMFDRVDEFRYSIESVLGFSYADESLCSHASVGKILAFFRNMCNSMQTTSGIVCPVAHMIHCIFRVDHGIDICKGITHWKLFLHLLQLARDIDVPFRILGLCLLVTLKFISKIISEQPMCSSCSVAHCVACPSVPRFIFECINKTIIFAESLQLLHPDWSFLKIFDLYQIAIGTMLHTLQTLETPSVSAGIDSQGTSQNGSLCFNFGHASVKNARFLKNCAFKIILKSAMEAADSSDFDGLRSECNIFWSSESSRHLHRIQEIIRSSLPPNVSSPIFVNHPILPSIGHGTKVADNRRILRILKSHNSCVHLASQAEFIRTKLFIRRCQQLLHLSRQKRKLATGNGGQQEIAASSARESAIAQGILSKALAEEAAWTARIAMEVKHAIQGVTQFCFSSWLDQPCTASDMTLRLLQSCPEIEKLAKSSINARQVIELMENFMCIVRSQQLQQRKLSRQQQQEQQQRRQEEYEKWHLRRQKSKKGRCVQETSTDDDLQNETESLRKIDGMMAWFLICDFMRICSEGAKISQNSQNKAESGFLRTILNFTNRVTGQEIEDCFSDSARTASLLQHVLRSFKSQSENHSLNDDCRNRILSPHMVEVILERPRFGKFMRCGIELLHILSNIELHLNSKIPVVMMDRIIKEILSISPSEHNHLYRLLNDVGHKDNYEGVKQSYSALSLEQLALGAFATVMAANLVPFNVALVELYFNRCSADTLQADILPLGYPLAFTFGTGAAAGSGLYFFVKQCQADSASGKLHMLKLVVKIVCATVVFGLFGLCFGHHLSLQDVAVEFYTCIFLMIAGAVTAATVFVRNLRPILRYGSKLIGM